MDDGRWTMDDGRWTMDDGRWTMNDGRWTMDDGRWTMDDGRWTTDDGRWTMDDGRWTMDDGRRTMEDRRSAVYRPSHRPSSVVHRPSSVLHRPPAKPFRIPEELFDDFQAIAAEEGLSPGELWARRFRQAQKQRQDGESIPGRWGTLTPPAAGRVTDLPGPEPPEIAARMGISEATVTNHQRCAMKKLKLRTRFHLKQTIAQFDHQRGKDDGRRKDEGGRGRRRHNSHQT